MKEKIIDITSLKEVFVRLYGSGGEIRHYFAPGRVNLIGEYIDFNGGYVFPCALTMGTYMVVRKREDTRIRFYSMNFEEMGVINSKVDDFLFGKENNWTEYPKGIIWTFVKNGYEVPTGMDILVYGDIPNGSGLSSSASIEVVTGLMLRDLFNHKTLSIQDIACMGQYSENNYNGMNCGIMDQFAIAMGKKNHAIYLNTGDLSYEYVPVDLGEYKIVIANTNKKRSLTESKYNERRSECDKAFSILSGVRDIKCLCDLTPEMFEECKSVLKDPVLIRRVKHTVYENERTRQAVAALRAGDLFTFGKLMNQSHLSLEQDYEVTGVHLDTLVHEAWKCEGVLGSRMTGAGFGGCTVSIVHRDHIQEFEQKTGEAYEAKTGYHADYYVAGIGEI